MACALASSALALGLTSLVAPFDAAANRIFADSLGLAAPKISFFESGIVSHAANLLVLTMASFGAECAVLKLTGVPRRIALLQVSVVAILGLTVLQYLGLTVTITSSLIAVILGGLTGNFFRIRENAEQQRESMFYELKLANRQLLEARLFMAKQDEVDRRLLAADLHDQVLNDLKLVSEKAKTMRTNPREDTAKEVERLLQQSMKAVREVMESLSPSLIEHVGFVAAIEDCLRTAASRGQFRLRFKCSGAEEKLDAMSSVEKILLYRLVQECCTNICKHAQASEVKVSIDLERLGNSSEFFCLRISDDGKGMNIADADPKSRGLQYMRQRAQLIGAAIVWLPGPNNKGTLVEIRWSPIADEKAKAGT